MRLEQVSSIQRLYNTLKYQYGTRTSVLKLKDIVNLGFTLFLIEDTLNNDNLYIEDTCSSPILILECIMFITDILFTSVNLIKDSNCLVVIGVQSPVCLCRRNSKQNSCSCVAASGLRRGWTYLLAQPNMSKFSDEKFIYTCKVLLSGMLSFFI